MSCSNIYFATHFVARIHLQASEVLLVNTHIVNQVNLPIIQIYLIDLREQESLY